MDDKEKVQLTVVGAIAAMIVVKGVVDIRRIRRLGKLNRKSIKAYEAEMLECIEQFKARMQKMADDPDITAAQFLVAYNEEMKFLRIVQNQILD